MTRKEKILKILEDYFGDEVFDTIAITDELMERLEPLAEKLDDEIDARIERDSRGNAVVIRLAWGIEDVLEQAKAGGHKLTCKQAGAVLEELERGHDATIGVNWDVISCVIDEILHREEVNP